MEQAKVDFLKNDVIFHLKHLAPDAPGKWGKMNGQQMVEHLELMVALAGGKKPEFQDLPNPEWIQKGYAWLLTDKPFRENTVNPLLPVEPLPVVHDTMQQAIEALQQELNYFFQVYEATPGLRVRNPVFGNLNFEEQVQLLYKHTRHHLRQFGLIHEGA